MSAMHIVKDALLKARKAAEAAGEEQKVGEKPSVSPHVAMDFVRRALDAAAPWWQTQGAAPKNGERIVNSPVERETEPTAMAAGRHMEAMQRKAGSRPPVGKLPDTPNGMDEALAMDGMAMDAGDMAAAATQMMSELEKHDKQHHPGGYKGGTCKLRDKVAHAAKNLGMSQKAVEKITNKSAGAEGGGSPDTEAPAPDDSPEFKEFDELRKNIMAETKRAGEGKSEEEQKALVKEAMGKLRSARFDYLTKALRMSPAEAGACSEIAEKVESGSEAAKKVVEELPDEKKKIVESVTATEETTVTGEGSEHADASGANEERSDAQFADELKKLMPEKAAMVDKLTQNFDTLNDLLNDEQKKRFWELNEGGDEAAFYTFLGDECGFTADEVSALRDLTDAYRAANPADYPEYAEQHKHDELLSRVKKADRRLNNDVKRGKLSGIKNRLEIKGFSEEEIGQYMDAMGLTEEQKFAVMNDLPVPPKVPTDAELKKAELEKKASDAMEAYRKAHDEAKMNGKDKDPATIKDLNDKFKAAMEAKKAANEAPTAESAAETAATAQAPAQQEISAPTETSGGGQEGNQAPTPKATKEESAAQPKDDPVAEGTSLQDHAAVCKANPKSNCPFLKSHMTQEQIAALDNPVQKAEPSSAIKNGFNTMAEGIKAAGAARLKEKGRSVDFKKDGAGANLFKEQHPDYVEVDHGDGMVHFEPAKGDSSSEGSTAPAEQSAAQETTAQKEPTTEAAEQQEPSREGGSKMPYEERRDELYQNIDKAYDALEEAQRKYDEAQKSGKGFSDQELVELRNKLYEANDAVSAALKAYSDSTVTGREDAQEGSSDNPSASPEATAPNEAPPPLPIPPEPLPEYKPPKVGGSEVELEDDEKQALDSLKQVYNDAPDGATREAAKQMYENYCASLDQKAAMMQAAKDIEDDERARAEEKKRPGFIQNMKDFFGGIAKTLGGDPMVENSPEEQAQHGLPPRMRQSEYLAAIARRAHEQRREFLEQQKAEEDAKRGSADSVAVKGGFTGKTPTTDIYDALPADQLDTSFGDDLEKDLKDEMSRTGIKANVIGRKDGSSVVEFEVKRDPSLSEADFKKKLNEIGQNLGRTFSFESSQTRGDGKKFTGYVRVTNPNAKDAHLRRLLEVPGSVEEGMKMTAPFLAGETPDGKPVWIDLGQHGFMGGDSGAGKTERIRGGLAGALHVKSPNELQLMINAHANAPDYGSMEGDPHVRGVADSVEKVRDNLKAANAEWNNRLALFKKENVKDLDEYNEKMDAQGTPEKKLPVLLVVTDEVTNLLQEDKSLADEIKRIVTNGRKFGVCHLGVTQDLRASNIPSDIKGSARMGLRSANSKKSSEMIFQSGDYQSELESLEKKGGMLAQTPNGVVRLRGTYAPKDDIKHLRDYNANTYKHVNEGANSGYSMPRPSKPSSPTHVSNMPDGMEIHKGDGGRLFFKHGGRQYKRARLRKSDGSVIEGWKLADGSDPSIFQLKPIST